MQFTQTKWVKEYFSFTKKERNAIIILGSLALLFSLLPTLFPFLVKSDIELVVDTAAQRELTALEILPDKNEQSTASYSDADLYQPKESRFEKYRREKTAGELFAFDPNAATAEEWKRLGLRDKTIQTILKYRTKGGKFYKAADLQRIYGLHSDEYKRLAPYIQIETIAKPVREPAIVSNEIKTDRKEYNAAVVDINHADTTTWKQLKGIGSAYARRIVNFRTKLGGFVSIEQVGETYGLPDSVFQKVKQQLRLGSSSINQIDVNNSTVEQLKAHPYIGFSVANSIVQYRSQHGNFSTITDLQKIGAIDEALYRKISPYLTVK
ncbi:ComEA family DNA-binding protein [Lacibacter sediminis]|uniref:Helix-hairpin-helix domain-containing protein n=1 Tax=Lacibacter sediminis TaxID=2760713 RepID=A0A7G5XEB0_9BACT|nr:helix-hairpin-helix domain-containing protein [Lacibacter sediminis]QNA43813.1 helix-hairpin-helix domain-containing protein [Lacibacter sediminis]